MVKCAVCEKEFKKISASHLKTHNMTRAEYRNKYGEEGLSNFGNCFRKVKIPYEPIDRYSINKYFSLLNNQKKYDRKNCYDMATIFDR